LPPSSSSGSSSSQNTRVVEVRFLFWKLEMSRSILLFGVLGVGAVLGWLFATVRRS
jgi:uncharacterized integral membrane protein